MPDIKYLVSRITSIDYKRMFSTARLVHKRSGLNTLKIMIDIIKCGTKYGAGYMDYLVFEFEKLNDAQRKTYITRSQNNRFVRLLNQKDKWDLLEDKTNFLKIFDSVHGRNWIDLREKSAEEFKSFCDKKTRIVAKPVDGTCGKGIEITDIDEKSDLDTLYNSFRENGQYLLEEYIVQHEDIARIYPLAVNTLRLVTIRNKDDVHIVFSCIRIGNNGKKVDNLNSGGMAAIIDTDTGIISTPGADKDGIAYEKHPFTDVALLGVKIPYFEEAKTLVKQAARSLEGLGYIGWDVAITESGPILIEANHFPGHDIYQFQVHLKDGIGLLPRFEEAIKGLE